MADWAQIPPEILALIVSRLPLLVDYIRFGAVCKPWDSVRRTTVQPMQLPWLVHHDQTTVQPMQLPWLVLHDQAFVSSSHRHAFGSSSHHRHSFFSLAERRAHNLLLPELAGRWCCGSSHGWLVTITIDLQMHLVHPFTRHVIPLPPPMVTGVEHLYSPTKLQSMVICKAILSADPVADPAGCIVIAIHGIHGKLTFCRLGDDSWHLINDNFGFYFDVVYYKDRFYGSSTDTDVVVCDLGPNPKTVVSVSGFGCRGFPNYLVKFNGDLFYVARFRQTSQNGDGHCITVKVEVFKLDMGTGKWSKVRDLGDTSLFLTDIHALPMSEHGFPGCKRNFLYFVDCHYNPNEIFINDTIMMCNVGNGKIEPCGPKDDFMPFLFPTVFLDPILRPGGETRSVS